MALVIKRVKVYLKLVGLAAAGLIVLLVVLMNRRRTADIWLFHEYDDVPVLWLILITAVLSVLAWWSVGKVVGVLRDYRELRRSRQAERQLTQQRRLAEELADRERRIDEKIRKSIAE